MNVTTYGVDLATNVFQIHGADARGKALVRKRLSRKKLLAYFANRPHSVIGLEACGSSHYWARRLRALGHEVRQISPQ